METVKTPGRIRSIDVFRGLTILLMIFVNDVAGVRDIPAWLKHAEAGSPGMTFVDVVFPAFLFIVGMSLPFALEKRRQQDLPLWSHIITRSLSLLILGLLMLNGPAVTSVSVSWWNLLMYLGAILFWSDFPFVDKTGLLQRIAKWSGFALLFILLIIYRRGSEGQLTWIQSGWWGILGEIGFAYFCAAALYLLLKDKAALFYSVPACCLLLYIADRSGQLDFLGPLKTIFYPGSHFGTHVLIAFGGVISGNWLYSGKDESKARILKNMGIFALLLSAAGWSFYGLYGIDKIDATPSWALLSTAICVLIFMLIYWIMDIKERSFAYAFFRPIAVNPLLAYLLHVMFIYIFRLIGLMPFYSAELGHGLIGIVRSIAYTGLIYLITALLSKSGLRLKL